MANSVYPDETARDVLSGSVLFANVSKLVCRTERFKQVVVFCENVFHGSLKNLLNSTSKEKAW